MRACAAPARRRRGLGRRQERGARRRQPVHARRHPRHEGRVRGHQRLRGGGLPGGAARGGCMNVRRRSIAALDLPASSRVDQRVPKKLLLENGAPTAADKRHINDGIEELLWLAALKPTTIGVPEYRDDVREYLEIAVLRLTLRAARQGDAAGRAGAPRRALSAAAADGAAATRPGLSAGPQALVAGRGGQDGAGRRRGRGRVGRRARWRSAGRAFRDALALGKQPRSNDSMRCIRAGSTRCWRCRRPA